MSAVMEPKARRALAAAITSSRSAADLAAALGDWAGEEENRRRCRDMDLKLRQAERRVTTTADLVVAVVRDYRARSMHAFEVDGDPEEMLKELKRRDSFFSMALGPEPELSVELFRAGLILREHVRGLNGGSRAYIERVDGGFMRDDVMEGLIDRRRPVRYALNAAAEAVEDPGLARGALLVVIDGVSLAAACEEAGIGIGGKQRGRVKAAVGDALGAAAAHLGIAA